MVWNVGGWWLIIDYVEIEYLSPRCGLFVYPEFLILIGQMVKIKFFYSCVGC